MRFSLRSRLHKAIFGLVCCLCAATYLRTTLREYLAWHLAESSKPESLSKAIQYEGTDSEYYDSLGRVFSVSVESTNDAITSFKRAVELNPYVSSYWLDLASAYQIAGRSQEQQESVEHAVQADPTTPHVAWEAANFFLIQGNVEKALSNLQVVLDQDPGARDPALNIAWRATGDSNVILDRVLSPRSDLYLAFLRLLIQKQETASAENVWNRLMGLKQAFSTEVAFPYFQFLLSQKEVAAAKSGWLQLAALNPSLAPYLSSPDNLIVNGGFEENVLNGGFDWQYIPQSHAALTIDTSEFHSGTRSLAVTFDGFNPADAGIFQLVPVEPNTEYEFTAECKGEELDTASGPRFSLTDAYTGASYVLTDDVLGTTPWREQRVRFRTGPGASLVLVKIVRQPASALIRGKFWVDDLKLVKSGPQA
jgi:Carbohydrate binding domain